MAKGVSKSVVEMLECREALVNTDELEASTEAARRRVLGIQAKLHRWARDDPHRRLDDVFNLVADPAFLLVAWGARAWPTRDGYLRRQWRRLLASAAAVARA